MKIFTTEQIFDVANDVADYVNFTGESAIRNFYAGKTICITGSTGFMGKCLVEKLLRGCPDIKRLYLLIRPKKQMKIEERMNKYFNDIIFDKLRKHYPNFMDKVTAIESDLIDLKGTLKPEDRHLITQDTDIIIHNGAMVFFSAQISQILKVNVLGTRDLLDIANECTHLESFVYVSTAYSHSNRHRIMEELYPPPGGLDMVNNIIQADMACKDGLSKAALKDILGDWPNQYVFSKAIAEDIIDQYSKRVKFSCAIFRPSVVISTYKEPIRGWLGNINGPVAFYLAYAMGVIHTFYLNDNSLDVIPADMTINALVVIPWDLTIKKDKKAAVIYNYGSSMENPNSVKKMREDMVAPGQLFPTNQSVWYPCFRSTRYPLVFWVLHVLLHFFPALAIDVYSFLVRGKKPVAVPIFFRITKHLDAFTYFANGGWQIHMRNLWRTWDRMSETDKYLFYYDIQKLSWDEYSLCYWYGIKKYILKDPMDEESIMKAQRKLLKQEKIHYACLLLLFSILFYFVYRLMMKLHYC